jgi:SNF2 family DNA or RNA helicase
MIHHPDEFIQEAPDYDGESGGDGPVPVLRARFLRVRGGRVEIIFPFVPLARGMKVGDARTLATIAAIKALFEAKSRRWDGKIWSVPANVENLRKLAGFAAEHGFEVDESVKALAVEQVAASRVNLAESRAASGDFAVEGLGGELLPYQRVGAGYCYRNKRVLLADEMRLGKTPQSLAAVQAAAAWPCLVVCPASLKWNWEKEVRRWLPGVSVRVMEGRGTKAGQRSAGPAGVVILNYDLLAARLEELRALAVRAIIFDEATLDGALRKMDTQRFLAAKELVKGVPMRLALTGTPIEHSVRDILSLLVLLDRVEEFGGAVAFRTRYLGQRLVPTFVKGCESLGGVPVERVSFNDVRFGDELVRGGKVFPRYLVTQRGRESLAVGQRGKTQWAEQVTRAQFEEPAAGWRRVVRRLGPPEVNKANLAELQSKLRSFCMIRRTRKDVGTELPAKRRELVTVDLENKKEYAAAQSDVLRWVERQAGLAAAREALGRELNEEEKLRWIIEQARSAKARAANAEELVKVNALRKLAARGKRSAVIEWTRHFLASGEALVGFAAHREIVQAWGEEFEVPVMLGDTPTRERQRMVEAFQAGRTKLLPMGLKPGSAGWTLPQASTVAFWELPWSGAALAQCEARIEPPPGQPGSVFSTVFMGRGTIDWLLWELCAEKAAEARLALGDRTERRLGEKL